MPSIIDIQAPQEPNARDTFDSLRLVAQQHAARTRASGAAQPRGHSELVALLTGTVQRAREAISVLEYTRAPTTPADADARVRELAAQRDIERAYGELLVALAASCGAIRNSA